MRHLRQRLTTALLTLLAFLAVLGSDLANGVLWLPGLAATAYPNQEIRGVWLTNVDSSVLFSQQTLEPALDQIAAAHLNTVYPTVWSWGYTLFPSAVATREIGYKQGLYPDLEAEGRNEVLEAAQGDRDLLLELVELAHQRQISVIPWFEFSFMTPANSELAARHPDWLTQRQGTLPAAQYYQEGRHRRVWLNPFHPQAQQFLLDIIAELMANYAVDGLQLDDHLGLPVEFGYDPYTQQLYQQEHGGRLPPRNPYNAEWMQWRANKITAFMERVFRVVKTYRPQAVVSVSPNPAQFAYTHFLQDWPRWERAGYIEELIVQVYRDNLSSFRAALQDPLMQRARSHIPTAIGILTGLKDTSVSSQLIQQQVEAVRQADYAGVSFFYYDSLWQTAGGSPEARQSAVESLFPSIQTRPAVAANRPDM
ncbi:MAG: family 10 glycosylhydrolase [Leptolyngbyaceae cyanobacterium SL_1_1]|nr:family 10 glycosylhydrolase [Leptolyngbyaceae cyanobacterium RM1_1_2]NJO08321.1 family 10 glycosylhydrolase [Leptolyngbyaceae cyanobacterium SL_1_1]